MAETKNVHDQDLVSCEICMKSIPQSEADCVEAEDYVAYFCGLDCYEEWKKQSQQRQDNSESED